MDTIGTKTGHNPATFGQHFVLSFTCRFTKYKIIIDNLRLHKRKIRQSPKKNGPSPTIRKPVKYFTEEKRSTVDENREAEQRLRPETETGEVQATEDHPFLHADGLAFIRRSSTDWHCKKRGSNN